MILASQSTSTKYSMKVELYNLVAPFFFFSYFQTVLYL